MKLASHTTYLRPLQSIGIQTTEIMDSHFKDALLYLDFRMNSNRPEEHIVDKVTIKKDAL